MTHSPFVLPLRRSLSLVWLLFAAVVLLGQPSRGQAPNRINPSFSAATQAPLKGSLHALARPEYDRGRASSVTKVPAMTLVFAPSAAQKTALAALLAAQQNPASPSYHRWLTPAQYAAQFGMSSRDIATTETWLQAQGFVLLDVSNGRDAIHFSGTVAQVESAFHTEVHQYFVDGTTHLANSTELTLPSELAGAVAGIRGIAAFRPHAMHTAVRRPSADAVKSQYTSSVTGNNLTPNDITTIYDIKALYNAGYTGTGQNIAIMGQSAIVTTDIDAFRAAAGLATKEPTQVLVPNTGTSTVVSGDEDESDIDLEWSNAIAPDATVSFVYTGNDTNVGVFNALEYAIDQNTAPILSISYGECELEASSDPSTFETIFMRANAQGQTILASAGDNGATGCDTGTSATQGLQVSYPASSAYVTAMGGTEFNEGNTSYWNATNDSGGGSAISYIPEAAWNETAASIAANSETGGLTGTGGGASILFGKPSWQVATNVPNDGARDVPDISLDAAVYHDGFLYCTAGSCANGYRDAAGNLTVAGGTSFDAPIFAGILALINQKNASSGAGNINANLYSLFGTAPSAFHDVTIGSNDQPCSSGSIDCPTGTTQIGFAAAAGYDQATGLGTIDAYNLAQVFPASTTVTSGGLTTTATTLSSATGAAITGTAVTFTASVSASSGTASPAGTVNFVVDGGTAVPVTLASGTASYAATFTTTGSHTIVATYAGDATDASSTASLAITVASATTTGSFTLAATNVTVGTSAQANSTLTLTGLNGYTGVVGFSYSVSSSFTGCLLGNNVEGVGTNGVVTSTLTVDTVAADCTSAGSRKKLALTRTVASASTSGGTPQSGNHQYPLAAAAMLAGLALLGRKRKAWPAAMVLLLAGLGTLSGCGGSSGATIPTKTTTGTYTVTLTATDTTNAALTASTTFTVTEQ